MVILLTSFLASFQMQYRWNRGDFSKIFMYVLTGPGTSMFTKKYTVPKAILWKEMFICTVRNVYQVLKKCFFTANHLAEKENFVLYIRNVCHTVFLSLQRNFSLPSSPLSFRAKSLLLSLFWYNIICSCGSMLASSADIRTIWVWSQHYAHF